VITKNRPESALILRLLNERKVFGERARNEIAKALSEHPGSTEEALVASRLVEERAIAEAYGQHLGIPWVDLVHDASNAHADDADAKVHVFREGAEPKSMGTARGVSESCKPFAELVSDAVCIRCKAVPIGVTQGCLDLACVNPSNFLILEEIQLRSGLMVRPHAATLSAVNTFLALFFGKRDMVREIASETATAGAASSAEDEDDHEVLLDLQKGSSADKDDQVVRIVNLLLRGAVNQRASDIHLEPYEDGVRVRYRIDGELIEVTPPPRQLFLPTISRLKILSKMDIAEKRLPQDGSIALKYGERRVDLRVNTVPTVYGEKMVIRLLEKGGIPASLQKLGFSEKQAQDFLEAARSPHGLVFVTGPTGSGKSTTLYTCLNLINNPTVNISTVEDPVEYRFHGLNQVQVRPSVGMDFSSALRAFLRQDPDVIMVGEVRDAETAHICMRAAMTGHLVLSTLHTSSSLEVINRLVDMGVEPFLLGPAIRLIEAQRLVRRLCTDCRQEIEVPPAVAGRHGLDLGSRIWRPTSGSCTTCRGTGYKGRVGLYEVVLITENLRELIERRAPQTELRRWAAEHGTHFLADAARENLLAGLTSLEEVSEYIRRVEES
jgi:type IV pilus assembly protein PilB